MRKIIKSYSIFILFLLMSMSVFTKTNNPNANYHASSNSGENGQGNVKKITTIIITGLNGHSGIDLKLQNGSGNSITNLSKELLEDGNKLVIKFTGNKAKSVAVMEDEDKDTIKPIFKNIYDTYTYNIIEGKISLKIAVKNGGGSPSFTGGGGATDIITIYFLRDIEVKTYEEYKNDGEIEDFIDGPNVYKFTKGGAGSYVKEPAIYVAIPARDSNGEKIEKLEFEKLDEDGNIIANKLWVLSEESGDVKINNNFFGEEYKFAEGANTVRVTSTNGAGNEVSKELKFVVDTRVNDKYLGNGIIGELDSDGKIVIDLASLTELSGIAKYSYTFKVGDKEKSNDEDGINKTSSTTLKKGSTDKIVIIDPSGLKGGSKGTLLFTVYDKLGHKKTYEKTYFLPEKPTGIVSKVEGETKQRNSRIKIVTEGNKDKFGIGSNIEDSSE